MGACIMTSSMESHCLSLREIPHTTKLFASFLEDFSRVSRYYAHPPTADGILAAAREVQIAPEIRRGVVEVLREQNRAFGADAATGRNIDRLAGGAVAIVTGQQVGLFSGPALQPLQSRLHSSLGGRNHAAEALMPFRFFGSPPKTTTSLKSTTPSGTRAVVSTRYELPLRESDADRRVGEVVLGDAVKPLVAKAVATLEGSFVRRSGARAPRVVHAG